jgi:hypothetical protein
MRGGKINLALMVIRVKMAPDSNDVKNLTLLLESFPGLRAENLAIVWTHCDKEEEFTQQKGVNFMNMLL